MEGFDFSHCILCNLKTHSWWFVTAWFLEMEFLEFVGCMCISITSFMFSLTNFYYWIRYRLQHPKRKRWKRKKRSRRGQSFKLLLVKVIHCGVKADKRDLLSPPLYHLLFNKNTKIIFPMKEDNHFTQSWNPLLPEW
jgi:hypothetical protein